MIPWFGMNLHIKSQGDAPGVYEIARRGRHMKHLSFTIVQLGGELLEHTFETGGEEVSLDFYTGPVRVEVSGPNGNLNVDVPARASIGDGHSMLYAPIGSTVKLVALNGSARITIGGAEGKPGVAPRYVHGAEVMSKSVGKDNFTRDVHTHIADNIDAAHLICGETINRPGGWSSCPPHKHDAHNPPSEVPMEEIYYFEFEPKQGFGFMRVYTDPSDPEAFDHAYPVQHGDVVLIPRGYHPVVACPGYTLNYTWVLAGEGRTYGAWADDPKHSWIKG